MTSPRSGSNQYQARGPTAAQRASRPDPGFVAAAADHELDSVGWAFHPDQKRWQNAGFDSHEQVAPWVTTGFTPVAARNWCEYGFTAPEAHEWGHAFGFDPRTAHWTNVELCGHWRDRIPDATTAVEWFNTGLGASYAARAITDGVTSEQAVQAWQDTDLTELMWSSWSNYGFSPTEASQLHAAGLNPFQADQKRTTHNGDVDALIRAHGPPRSTGDLYDLPGGDTRRNERSSQHRR